MTAEDKERLLAFLDRKMCKPCRESAGEATHEGCREAHELRAIVQRS